jgi:hypothetical protein
VPVMTSLKLATACVFVLALACATVRFSNPCFALACLACSQTFRHFHCALFFHCTRLHPSLCPCSNSATPEIDIAPAPYNYLAPSSFFPQQSAQSTAAPGNFSADLTVPF